ncbi:rhamnulokinase [Enterococcus timonensis]|uniref:rhamnulokinase n=1 Tax=Enterococcus timonensis TaxID=1852364 RepID=UPI0008D9A643|nr:rhamnulokinase family protein [Enterococcus timonensis]
MKKNVLAFDFGASSGRVILGKYADGKIELEEIHRFANTPIEKNGTLSWDFPYLFQQILVGIKKATATNSVDSLGIDTWGVDFGLLDEGGQLILNPVNYRDLRTKGILTEAAKYLDLETIYQRTGNQIMEINTLFQLLAVKLQQPELFKKAKTFLFMPDLMNYFLTGKMKAERSIASTSQLINAQTKKWDEDLMKTFGFSKLLFPSLVTEGNFLGMTNRELGVEPIAVFNVCQHDTASAVVSVPSNQESLFVSCGTWSLVGTELNRPIINEKAFQYNLTNESGMNGTTHFLKNCTGLWIIQEVKRNLEKPNRKYSYDEITDLAYQAPAFKTLIDTDHPDFIRPGNMIARIKEYARKTKQAIPETDGEIFRCIYESLAMKYKYTFLEISDAVGKNYQTVNIVGGGSQSKILCQMVADAANFQVSAGPVEATAIGNLSVQLLAQNVFKDLQEVRGWIKKEFEIKQYVPSKRRLNWDLQFERYQLLLDQEE